MSNIIVDWLLLTVALFDLWWLAYLAYRWIERRIFILALHYKQMNPRTTATPENIAEAILKDMGK